MSSADHPRTLAGRYRLDEVVGRGGMSTVYRGTDLALDRVVAVKVALDPLAEENPVYVARFKREARAAAALSHPGAVTVYDAGADGATRFIVMEFVEGRSLADILRDERPLEPTRAAYVAEQVANTLAAAHAAGIVHRDIKPGNIMVEEGAAGARPRVKVLDFGIARTADAVTLTQTASVLGTAPYMAPEQAMGNPADARSDIYSLGCVLYEMLTGQPPFMGDMPAAVLHQHVRVEPKAPTALNPKVPPALDALTLQMLAKKPEDRPQTATEVRDRLVAFRTEYPAAPTAEPAAPAAEPSEPSEPTEAPAEPTAPTARLAPPAVETLAGVAAAAAEVPQVATVGQPATVPPEATAATRRLPAPAPPHRSRRALWTALAALSVLLLGAAVAFALSGTGGGSGTSTPAPPKHVTTTSVTGTQGTTRPTTGTPTTTTTTSPTSTTQSTPSTTTTTVTTTTTNPPPAPGGAAPVPPGQQKKQGKTK